MVLPEPVVAIFVFLGSLRILYHNSHATIDRRILHYLERVVQRRVVLVVFWEKGCNLSAQLCQV
jgi:hypothetical protein